MKYWPQLVKTALLGTEKTPLDRSVLPAPVREALERWPLAHEEDQLYKAAALLLAYEKAGTLPPLVSAPVPAPAPEELRTLMPPLLAKYLGEALREKQKNAALLHLLLEKADQKSWVCPPELLPELLSAGENPALKSLHERIRQCAGARGHWLARLNPAWKYLHRGEGFNWEEAGNAERRQALETLRKTDPAAAFSRFRSIWEEETNTREKINWLKVLFIQPRAEEMPFMEALFAELKPVNSSGKAVLFELKKMCASWLMGQPGSVLNQEIVIFLSHYFKNEKKLLGLTQRSTFELPLKEDVFFSPEYMCHRLGFEAVSTLRGLPETHFWACELARSLHPAIWEQVLGTGKWSQILEMLEHTQEKSKASFPLLAYLSQAIARTRYAPAAEAWLEHYAVDESNYFMLQTLTPPALENYFIQKYPRSLPDFGAEILCSLPRPWSPRLSRFVAERCMEYSQYHFPYQNLERWQEFAVWMDLSVLPLLYDFVKQPDRDWQYNQLRSKLVSPWIHLIEIRRTIQAL